MRSMRRLASQLRRASGNGIPVSLLECARHIDHREVIVFDDALEAGLRGGVRLEGGRWLVILNAADSRQRSRFTLAHELGHIALGDGGVLGDGRALGDAGALGGRAGLSERAGLGEGSAGALEMLAPRAREAICDAFAVELLLPAVAVRAQWRQRAEVRALADRFDVSVAAARRRVRSLGLSERATGRS